MFLVKKQQHTEQLYSRTSCILWPVHLVRIGTIYKSIYLIFFYRATEVKEHPFFKGIDWTQVYLQKYPPPLIPPRGEVNAADAFDIGSFDEEDTKGIKVCYYILSFVK